MAAFAKGTSRCSTGRKNTYLFYGGPLGCNEGEFEIPNRKLTMRRHDETVGNAKQ